MNKRMQDRIGEWMDQGLGGRLLAARYTEAVDEQVKGIFEKHCTDPGLLLVATGGYGRRELAPYSDIDILFISEKRANAEAAEKVLYGMWDEMADVSHAYRTLKECSEEAFKDIRTRTALLETRYLAGNRELFAAFRKDVYPAIAARKQRQFVSAKLAEREQRHAGRGDSVYLLEPHIKEGDGGLRDVHAVFWLARVVFKISEPSGLEALLTGHDLKRFMSAYDFMIRIRYCLHLESRRRNDILSFEYQRAVAARLGFRDSRRFSGAERMMRYYYIKAGIIRDISDDIIARCGREYAPFFRDFTKKRLTDDFSLSGGKLIARHDAVFSGHPEKILEACHHLSVQGKGFSSHLKDLIRGSLTRINSRTRGLPAAVQFFRAILKGSRVYETLREMHETGILGRFIPEFGALKSLVVHEPYHMFTVDEHTLLAIRNLERLGTTSVGSLEPLQQIARAIERPDLLYLAILLHDIGKAAGKHHEEEGYRRLKSIMERLNVSPAMRLRTEFLVRNHILMSRIAMTRELDDPEVIAQFAGEVGDSENLKAIYLMTYADMSAVNPRFWNPWKASLLAELYARTAEHLAGAGRSEKKGGSAVLFPHDEGRQRAFELFIESMPERYILSTTDAGLKEDFLLYERSCREGAAVHIDADHNGIAELVICAPDGPGLFARIVGFLSSKKLNIVHGRIYTGKSRFVIDKISISNWREIWWQGFEQEVAGGLEALLRGQSDIPPPHPAREMKAPGLLEAFVELDNESSDAFTLIEVVALDRMGLLHDISRIFHAQGADIVSARINTEAGHAQDIFSLSSSGSKLEYRLALDILGELWKMLKE